MARTDQQRLAADQATHRRLRDQRRADGVCPSCGLAPPVPGGQQCADCRAANAQQMRRRRAALKAMGRCQDCGKKKFTHHVACGACSKVRRDRQARYQDSRQ